MGQIAEQLQPRLAPYDPAADAGITFDEWASLTNSIFPGAKPESIMMAVSYCRARRLDFLRKPVHIVPMKVKRAGTRDQYEYRDVIMEGINSLRVTAARTGEMAGTDEAVFGPIVTIPVTDADDAPKDVRTIDVPLWCSVTVHRLDKKGAPRPYTHKEFFLEACARDGGGLINSMWRRRCHGQLSKCAEAGALRKAFPEEIGNTYVVEELEGKVLDDAAINGEFSVVGKGDAGVPDPTEVADPAEAIPDPVKEPDKPKPETKKEPEPEPKNEPAKEPPKKEASASMKEMPVQSEAFKIDLPGNAVNLLRKKMATAGVTEEVLHAKFGYISTANVNEALRFCSQYNG